MNYGISEISIIPVRKESAEQSEMVTQILFGESFQIVETKKDWAYIKLLIDNYEGWINSNCITTLSLDEFNEIKNNDLFIVNNLTENIINQESKENTNIPFGSSLPNFNKGNYSFQIKSNKYYLDNYSESDNNKNISAITKQFLNSPYLWGGKNPFGIDCSGFTQVIYKALGIFIPRDASQQVKLGKSVSFISDTKPGDLAFFDDNEGNIIHVGIVLDQNEIIHSSVKVRIDTLDQQGIYNKELKKYTHKLRVIKRILE